MKKIILASASPRRRELMQLAGYEFETCPSGCEETCGASDAAGYVQQLALKKAEDVTGRAEPETLVIGADTVVVLDGRILGKPAGRKDAYDMLRLLSGRRHKVFTGVALVDAASGHHVCFAECTEVEFYDLTDGEIQAYLETGEPFDKAGAYGIQGKGALLVKAVYGDYYNVVGLPVARLSRELETFVRQLC